MDAIGVKTSGVIAGRAGIQMVKPVQHVIRWPPSTMERLEGFEPSTLWMEARCSTSELQPHIGHGRFVESLVYPFDLDRQFPGDPSTEVLVDNSDHPQHDAPPPNNQD